MLHSINHNHSTIYSQQTLRLDADYHALSDRRTTGSTSSDAVSLGSKSALALTYTSDVNITERAGNSYGMLQNLVANLLKEQGIDTQILTGDTSLDIASISPEDAQELIADDGYFGVEQTSDRIFHFAVGVAGGDPSRIDAIREGIDNGFSEALEAFGGWLPDISYATYDTVMEKLDNWVSESAMVV